MILSQIQSVADVSIDDESSLHQLFEFALLLTKRKLMVLVFKQIVYFYLADELDALSIFVQLKENVSLVGGQISDY